MILVIKVLAALVVLAVAVVGLVLWDVSANDGRLMAWVTGRDTLVATCTPPLQENLVGKGFSPVDLSIGRDEAIGFSAGSFGRSRSLSGSFSFSDGEDGPRVDGHLLCTVHGPSVEVDVVVETLPRRVT